MTEHEAEMLRTRLEKVFGVPQPPRSDGKPSPAVVGQIEAIKPVAGRLAPKRARKQTKTEEEFERILKARYPNSRAILWEALKFRLATRTWYTPDFVRVGNDGHVSVYEVKGSRIWDDAIVKFKVAEEQFPFFTWELWQSKQGEWKRLL